MIEGPVIASLAGEASYPASFSVCCQPEGSRRAIVIFQLVRLNSMNEAGIEDDVDEPKPSTLDDARKLALQAIESGEQSATGNALRNIYESPQVS